MNSFRQKFYLFNYLFSKTIYWFRSTSRYRSFSFYRRQNFFNKYDGFFERNFYTAFICDSLKRFVGTTTLIGTTSAAAGFIGGVFSDSDFFGNSNSKIFEAARENDYRTVERLLTNGEDVNQRHFLGWTPLHVAAFHGATETVNVLLNHGANVNCIDEFTSLMKESEKKRISPIEILFQRQNDFSQNLKTNSNFRGTSPLHYAVLGNSVDVVKLLIQRGADPLLENDAGHRPADYAKDEQMKRVLADCMKVAENLKESREREERLRYPLEQRLKEVLVGQESAIAAVAETIRRKENGWYDDEHPLVFLFLGSSGIGKTELAKQVAKYLHKDVKKAFIRIDMSEYQTKHEVAKFIGSPPGYIGHEEGGQLTKKLKEFPKAVVLFDEVEKAHPDILTIMLQLFDEGRLTDGKGTTVECKEAIFIMTSNLASEEIANYAVKLRDEASLTFKDRLEHNKPEDNSKVAVSKTFKEKVVQPILKRHLKRDEFLGRITEIVYFLPFSRSELITLVTKELELWKKRASERHKVELLWDRNVLDVLADGYNVHYGARSIKHEVERRVVNKLASAHERGLFTQGAKVRIFTNWSSTNDVATEATSDSSSRHKASIELEIVDKGGDKNRVLDSPVLETIKKIFV